jgi:hypothetical protein
LSRPSGAPLTSKVLDKAMLSDLERNEQAVA